MIPVLCAYVHVWSNDGDNFRHVFRYGEALYCLKTSGRVVCSVTIITMSRRGWNGWFHMLSHKITHCLRLSCFVRPHKYKYDIVRVQYLVVLLHFAFRRKQVSVIVITKIVMKNEYASLSSVINHHNTYININVVKN